MTTADAVAASLRLPSWVGLLGSAILALVAAFHLVHAVTARGPRQRWHASHVLMALGMVDMLWPSGAMPVTGREGVAVFATAAALFAFVEVRNPTRGGGTRWLAIVGVVNLAAMAYMFAMPAAAWAPLTLVLVIWCATQLTGWPARAGGVAPTHARAARSAVAVMSIAMGYMLLTMQWAAPTAPAMPGMPGMASAPPAASWTEA